MEDFDPQELSKLFKPQQNSSKEDNGQVTIIGGSDLFHGAPILALKVASRIVDMVFFSSPEPAIGQVAEKLKSQLAAFIWVPFDQVGDYLKKSDAVLIGPGFLRFRKESQKKECSQNRLCDTAGKASKKITENLLKKFPQKQWIIDGGSLQVMDKKFIPKGAILTPNRKEFKMLFGTEPTAKTAGLMAKKYQCLIVLKGAQTVVCSAKKSVLVNGGNAGLTKGGTGDVLAGLTAALATKNDPLLAATAASLIVKKAADQLYQEVGFAYNADDLAQKIPEVLGEYWR